MDVEKRFLEYMQGQLAEGNSLKYHGHVFTERDGLNCIRPSCAPPIKKSTEYSEDPVIKAKEKYEKYSRIVEDKIMKENLLAE